MIISHIKQRFKRAIPWDKYRSEITAQSKNDNLDYLTDPTFRNINRLFVLTFKNGNNDPTRDSVNKYYMPCYVMLCILYFDLACNSPI